MKAERVLWAAAAYNLLFGVFAGMQTVVFQTLLSKVIPVNYRGRLMGLRNFLASLTTVVVAWFGGNYLVGSPPTAAGYGWVFLLAFVLTTTGLLVLALVVTGFVLAHQIDQQPATIAMSGAALLMLLQNLPHQGGLRLPQAPGLGFVGIHRERFIAASARMGNMIGATPKGMFIPGIDNIKYQRGVTGDGWMQP